MACLRSGECCKSVYFVLENIPVNEDKREIGRWASYHPGVQVMRHRKDGVDYLAIKVPSDCMFLTKDEKGLYGCAVYESRPQICKEYLCQAAKDDDTAKKLIEENMKALNNA